MTNQPSPTFGGLLRDYLAAADLPIIELARRLAGDKRDDRKAVENKRRALQRYLTSEHVARAPQRAKIIAALGLPADAFDAVLRPGVSKHRRDRIAEIEGLLGSLTEAVGEAEAPAAESIRGLLAELAAKLAQVQEAEADTTRLLGQLETRVERLEGRDESDEARATGQTNP